MLGLLPHVVDSNQLDGMLELLPCMPAFLSCQCCAMTLPDIEASFTKRKGAMSIQPWITCLQSGILIRHLDARYPEQASKVDLQQVMGTAESFQEIQDARAFLTDPSNWIPHSVFRELIKRCEVATGQKDFTYQAALA